MAQLADATTPTRFDPDDRSTWPEEAPQRVLIGTEGQPWYTAMLMNGMWVEDFSHPGVIAKNGDLWLPLPPTRDHYYQAHRKGKAARPDEYAAAWADGETQEHQRKAEG